MKVVARLTFRRQLAMAIRIRIWLRRIRTRAFGMAQEIGSSRLARLPWRRGAVRLLVCTAIVAAVLVADGIHYLRFDRTNLPDLETFNRFEFPTIGHVYDVNGQTLVEMVAIASEYR